MGDSALRLCTILVNEVRSAAVYTDNKIVTISEINENLGTSIPNALDDLIHQDCLDDLQRILHNAVIADFAGAPVSQSQVCAPYLNPPKIWGIGLNFAEHAKDLNANHITDEPVSFMKPNTTIIGHGEPIILPLQSKRVTGEAELGVIIGKECKNVSEEKANEVISGYTTILDMTAEDILQRNPRFLTRAKSFDTFFSFGPWIVTPDEILDIQKLKITTLINHKAHRSNFVENMTFSPYQLISFHSKVMTLQPGDIISCGTPGAVVLRPGDHVGCEIKSIGRLENPVRNTL